MPRTSSVRSRAALETSLHTPEYLDQIKQKHQTDANWGTGSHKHAKLIRQQFRKGRVKTVLDWGCGKATLKDALPEMEVTNYDPGVPEYASRPVGVFDLVVATHVLEHVEPELLQSTLRELDGFTRKALFIIVPHEKAKELLPDGRNAHLIVEPRKWWFDALRRVWRGRISILHPDNRNTTFLVTKNV